MKILLFVPSSKFVRTVIRDVLYGCWCCGKRIGGGSLPPLTLLSVATVLKNDGNDVRLLDTTAQDIDRESLAEEVGSSQMAVILTSTMTFVEDCAVLAEFKKMNASVKTVLFGAHPTFMPGESLARGSVDIIVRREPEFIIRDLSRSVAMGGEWKMTKGIGYKENGWPVINPDYPYITDLDLLPVPDRSLLPRAEYYNPIVLKSPYATAETSRGCPGKCIFCTAPNMYGGLLRCRSVGSVLNEIEYLKNSGYKEIYYRDETWTTFKARNKELLHEMIDKKYGLSWICNVRAGTVDKEDLVLMRRAGCHLIKVGVESGSQRILDASRKMIRLADVKDLFRWANEAGISTHAHLMIGMPGEDKASLVETGDFIKKIRPGTIDIGICTPYPGTELFKRVLDTCPDMRDGTGVSFENLHKHSFFNQYFTVLTVAQIESALKKIYRDFYFRPSYIISRLLRMRRMSDLQKAVSAGARVIDFACRGK